MSSEELTIPDTLHGMRSGREATFDYTLKNGDVVRVVGVLTAFLTRDGACAGIEVRVNLARTTYAALVRKLSRESPRDPRFKFDAARIIPVREAPAAWQPRHLEPTEKQVAYALDLAGRWENQGGSLYPGMTRERFQAMSRHELGNWIGTARSEMGEDDL